MIEAAASPDSPETGTPPAPCVTCGYDLRGLDPAGSCPECGEAIRRSLAGDRLADAAPDWLRLVVRGQRLIAAGTVTLVAVVLVAVGLNLAIGLLSRLLRAPAIGTMYVAVDYLGEIGSWAGLIMVTAGVFLLTTQEPRERLRESARSPRNVARGALAATIVLGAAFSAVAALPVPLTAARGLRYGLGGLLAVFATVGVVALLRQLERMAARIPDAALVGQTRRDARRMAWLLPATVLTAIGAQISGFLVGGTGRLSAAISLVQGLMMVASLVLLLTLIGHCASMARLMTKLRRAFVACLEASRDRARGVSSS